jgi:hypothetical protein
MFMIESAWRLFKSLLSASSSALAARRPLKFADDRRDWSKQFDKSIFGTSVSSKSGPIWCTFYKHPVHSASSNMAATAAPRAHSGNNAFKVCSAAGQN